MLKKLLKYDISRMKKMWRLYAIALPCLAVVLAFSIRMLDINPFYDDLSNELLNTICIFGILIGAGGIAVSAVFNSVFLAKYMGRDFYSDAGQLTFTLPIKRDDLFLSKFLNSLIWITASNLSIILTVFLCFLISSSTDNGLINMDMVNQMYDFIRDGFFTGGIAERATATLLVIIVVEINVLMPNLLNYCVIKCQSSGGMGMYIGLMIGGLIGVIILVEIGANGYDLIVPGLSEMGYMAFVILSLLADALALAVLNFALFFSARDRLKYNFNLY